MSNKRWQEKELILPTPKYVEWHFSLFLYFTIRHILSLLGAASQICANIECSSCLFGLFFSSSLFENWFDYYFTLTTTTTKIHKLPAFQLSSIRLHTFIMLEYFTYAPISLSFRWRWWRENKKKNTRRITRNDKIGKYVHCHTHTHTHKTHTLGMDSVFVIWIDLLVLFIVSQYCFIGVLLSKKTYQCASTSMSSCLGVSFLFHFSHYCDFVAIWCSPKMYARIYVSKSILWILLLLLGLVLAAGTAAVYCLYRRQSLYVFHIFFFF